MGMILLNGAMARLFLTCPHTHGDDPCISDDQNVVTVIFPYDFRKCFYAADNLRLAVRKKRQGDFKCCLKDPAVNLFQLIHGC